MAITVHLYLPTLERIPPCSDNSGGPPFCAPIRGISARWVYPWPALLQTTVSSYLTFSPLLSSPLPSPREERVSKRKRLFSVALSLNYLFFTNNRPAVSRSVTLCCPDFPPLTKVKGDNLHRQRGKDTTKPLIPGPSPREGEGSLWAA